MKPNKNPENIKNIFNEISQYYDIMNNCISFGMHKIIKKSAIKFSDIMPNSKIIDICTGTGDLVKFVSRHCPDCEIIGIDISEEMLKKAKIKNPTKQFIQADVTNLPFKDNSFDYVISSFGIRNIENRQKALSEIYRILKKDGKFLHLDFGYHNFFSKIFDFFLPFIVFLFRKNQQEYIYLKESKNDYPEPEELIKEFCNIGFNFYKEKDYLLKTISLIIFQK